ncbi:MULTISPECIES: hypothetical protein [Lysinibacillus]|uniref:hypothetical protein n=1 Tax=Lysinibacillus TaxID=400634 RepID=UPI0021A77EE7|nr:hypothetical protein [Lysinibacillus capsici]MCT1538804.1 hypothetical protein [Lysinibacillus capsici]MCT1569512.1 hypothetical protein [Lysinibacillus capsici]MCT1646527.1 hypothetical protein [Lysinibacillus capsici]MCT1724967.1 hypothetical protein [Lysinibacillus capsici]MCT1784579.1 hypothetical protein [Lysinibacillus capsici]
MEERPKQQIYGYELEPVDISDMLSFVESRQEVHGNKPKVTLSMYGDNGKWHVDAAVRYKGREGKDEFQPFLLKSYKQLWRAEKYAREIAEEHGFSYEGLNPSLTNSDMFLQYQKRKHVKDTFTKDMRNEIEQHGTELMKVVETQAIDDENDQSFLTKKEVEHLISEQFNRIEIGIEQMLNSVDPQSKRKTFADYRDEMKNLLKECRQHFKDSIIERTLTSKQKMDDKVIGLRNGVRDSISEVKDSAKSKLMQSILYMNERLKDFTTVIDQKLYEHEPVQLDRKQNKAMAAQAHER